MKGFDAVAAALASEGVEVIFGLIGGGVDRLVYSLVNSCGVRFIATRHEQAAVGMADGYSRATGKIGVAIVSAGPGLTNAGTTMTAARLAKSSVLIIAGDSQAGSRHNPMLIHQPPFIAATAGAFQQIRSQDTLEEDVQLAFRHLRLGRGPIALQFPGHLANSELPAEWSYTKDTLSEVTRPRLVPDGDSIARVVELIDRRSRPVVLAGRGAVDSGAHDALVTLAERIGAVLSTTLLAKGWFRGHPFDVGLAGGFAPADVRSLLAESDLILAFGAGLNRQTTDHGRMNSNACVVQVDRDPARIGDTTPVDVAVVGDVLRTAEMLLEMLGPAERPGWQTPDLAKRIAAMDRWQDAQEGETPGFANPYLVARACEELLPPERLLLTDIGLYMGVPATHVSVPEPTSIVFPWQFGAVGCGIPAAIGAAVGRPDRLVTAFIGDGGLMAGLTDLETAARCGIPLLVVVMDDGGFAAERRLYRRYGGSTALADYCNPDFAALARSVGYDAYSVTSRDEMRRALQTARPGDQPTLIHVKIDPETHFPEMERALEGGL